jgi:hypothetical protein
LHDFRSGSDREKIRAAIARYDELGTNGGRRQKNQAGCATLYKAIGFDYRPGLGAAINRDRKI